MKNSFAFLFMWLFLFSKGHKLSEWFPFSNCSISTRTRTCKTAHECKNIQLVETIPCVTRCPGFWPLRDENNTRVKRNVKFDAKLNRKSTLTSGRHLNVGSYLSSGNGYYAVMQADGNFVLFVTQHWVAKMQFGQVAQMIKEMPPEEL
ncbi:uncharacterized protein LOC105845663 [Hydra vulgaris]|uniref:uncharacterized protein LOC105845663 n=1 Tax=Hydra vulgaris TaxID=6087 RepID=UPI001F5F7C1D|nr:uncharacterized protein LOC105845663 isoform X1 [Hydra vulgaris]XP_047140647.1 uncharacterized protein LOC105845663 isoform X1 [Hydra vulgaris]